MKQSTKNRLYYILSVAIASAFFIVFFYRSMFDEIVYGTFSYLFVLVGLALAPVLHVVFHEVGHIVVSKIVGFKIFAFRLGFLCFDWRSGKMRVSFALNTDYAGMVVMAVTSPDNVDKKAFWSAVGGILGSMLCLVFGGVMTYVLSSVVIWLYVFGAFVSASIYCVLVNLFPINGEYSRTDGAICDGLLRGDDVSLYYVRNMQLEGLLFGGVRPKDLPKLLFENLPVLCDGDPQKTILKTIEYYKALDAGDEKALLDCSAYFAELCVQGEAIDPETEGEMLWVNLFNADLTKRKLSEEVLNASKESYERIGAYLEKKNDVTSRRIVLGAKIALGYDGVTKTLASNDRGFVLRGIEIMENGIISRLERLYMTE